MAPASRSSVSLNPLWPFYGGCLTLLIGFGLGFLRYNVADYGDPFRCSAMFTTGRWLDWGFGNWQPEGCMIHAYKTSDVSACLNARTVTFLGDSVVRKLFFIFSNTLDESLPTSPPDNAQRHADHLLRAKDGTQLSFYWDPFWNSTHIDTLISQAGVADESNKASLLVIGSGLWYLRYADTSGGLPAWEAKMETVLNSLAVNGHQHADEIVVLPIQVPVPVKLSKPRADTIHTADIDAMNSDLLHRVASLTNKGTPPAYLPTSFNLMLDESQTEDGLHYSDVINRAQANLLLNHRCNRQLPQKFPFDSTCCKPYPYLQILNSLFLAGMVLSGPVVWLLKRGLDYQFFDASKELQAGIVISVATVAIFVADRTSFWLKEQKQFDPWTFAFLNLLCLVAGLATMKRADKDLGFLNREQTDEWKGWMQLAILIYHYLGASKVSGIYNPIRILVAAYLFMTGYGHTTFYIKKADFGFRRIAQVLVRLNLFTLVLAYTMNTDYLFYYFSPLITAWFGIIYLTMIVGSQYNDRAGFLIIKFLASMAFVTGFMHEPRLLQWIFKLLSNVFNIQWSAREWTFRFKLDLWIVYFGMFTAVATIKLREHRLLDHPQWPLAYKLGVVGSVGALLWFFAFELMQESKFAYNAWHPYIAFIPVGSFVILRNATPLLRSVNSRLFAFVGTCSLETFIIQYHLWLAADTKGILIIIPGARWRPVNMVFTSTLFIFVSHQVAQATGHLTTWICNQRKETLPTTAPLAPPVPQGSVSGGAGPEVIPLMASEGEATKEENNDARSRGEEADSNATSPARPRWAERLAERPSPRRASFGSWTIQPEQWQFGMNAKLFAIFVCMWFLNIFWRGTDM